MPLQIVRGNRRTETAPEGIVSGKRPNTLCTQSSRSNAITHLASQTREPIYGNVLALPLPLRLDFAGNHPAAKKLMSPLSKNSTFGLLQRAALATLAATLLAHSAYAEGDAEAGELLSFTCLGCHGIEGYRNAYPSYRVPRLGGQRAGYIINALTAYKAGTRAHPTMQAQGGSLSEQDIEDIAAWFQGETAAADSVTMDDVANLDPAKTCVACHGEGS